MKLYYSTGACSLSPHIVLKEIGLPFEAIRVDLKTHRTEHGDDFYQTNPKGYVPILQLDNGQTLSEGPAIVQYLADLKPESKLAPAWGTMERYRLIELLNFISTELHKTIGTLFNPALGEDARAMFINRIESRLKDASELIEGKDYLMGSQFTVADAYLFTVLNWLRFFKMDLSPRWPLLKAYSDRVAARPAVIAAMSAEGLIKTA
jgi:glutathione S-transferase